MAVHQLPRALIIGAVVVAGLGACSNDDVKQIATPSDAACNADFGELDAAVDLYSVTEGQPAASEDELIEAGFLTSKSNGYDVDHGAVVPQAGSGCEVPQTTAATTSVARSSPPPPRTTVTLAPPTIAADDCRAESDRVAIAVLAWVNGGQALPVTQAELVAAGFLAGESQQFDLGPDGTPVAIGGAGCA